MVLTRKPGLEQTVVNAKAFHQQLLSSIQIQLHAINSEIKIYPPIPFFTPFESFLEKKGNRKNGIKSLCLNFPQFRWNPMKVNGKSNGPIRY